MVIAASVEWSPAKSTLCVWLTAALILLLASSGHAESAAMGPRVGVGDETVLVRDGEPRCAIVYPGNGDEYPALVARVKDTIAHVTGVAIPSHKDTDVVSSSFDVQPGLQKKNLILLGSLNTNRAFVRLAANFHLYASCVWPGDNGYELRTVTNPYGTKTNCIVLGGSDAAGVGQATAAFLKSIDTHSNQRGLTAPRLLTVVVGGKEQSQLEPARLSYDRGAFGGTYRFATAVEAYALTGSPARLKEVRQLIEHFLTTDFGPTASDYGTEAAIRALDVVDSLVMTPDENRRMDNKLLAWVRKVIQDKPYWNALGRKWAFGGHQACGALSFHTVINYLLRNGTPNPPARKLLESYREQSRQFLNYHSTSFKDEQKDVGWETWTPLTVLPRYALAEGDMTFFETGTALQVVRRYFYAERGTGPAAFLGLLSNDGSCKLLAPEGGHLSGWAFVMRGATWTTPPDVEPRPPSFLIGTKVMPASRTDWEHARSANTSGWHTHLPWERTFHLAGFADGVDPADQFAVLGAWDSTNSPGETNAFRVFRQHGHRFLFRVDGEDQRQPRPGRFYQNALVVTSGRYTTLKPPCAAELLAHHDGSEVGMVAGRLADYGGADWDRHVFWRRGTYFAVLDVCQMKEAGSYSLTNQWWTYDVPGLVEYGWVAHTGKGTFRLMMDDVGAVESRQWWDDGPYQLRQTKWVNVDTETRTSFCNAFWVEDPNGPLPLEVRKVGPTAMMVAAPLAGPAGLPKGIALMGYAYERDVAAFGRLDIQAAMFYVSPAAVALKGGSRLSVDGRPVLVDNKDTPDKSSGDRIRRALSELWVSLPPASRRPDRCPASTSMRQKMSISLGERLPVARTDYARLTGVAFTQAEDSTLTWDLGRTATLTRIDGIRCEGETVDVLCSNDNFSKDIRTITAQTGVRHHWVKYQYGFGADLGQGTIGPIDQLTRYVRIRRPADKLSYGLWIAKSWHNQDWNIKGHNRERFARPFWQSVVFRGDRPVVVPTRSTAADIDGDGNQEVIASTDQNELIVVGADGRLRWKQRFAGPVLNFICHDLERDGRREVIVASHDNRITCLEHDGRLRFDASLLIEGTLRAVANSLSTYPTEDGRRGMMVATYHQCLKLDPEGRFIAQMEGPGFYFDTALPTAVDFTGDGVGDFVVRENVWGTVGLIDGKQFDTLATRGTYAGKGLAIMPWSTKSNGRIDAVLVLAEQGIVLVRPAAAAGKTTGGDAAVVKGGIESVFRVPVAPVTGWDVADLNGDGAQEIVIGTRYGLVVVIDGRGHVAASALIGPEVRDVAVVGANGKSPKIVASTGRSLHVLDRQLRSMARAEVQGAPCLKLQSFQAGDRRRAMCLFEDGTAAAVLLSASEKAEPR